MKIGANKLTKTLKKATAMMVRVSRRQRSVPKCNRREKRGLGRGLIFIDTPTAKIERVKRKRIVNFLTHFSSILYVNWLV